MSGSQQVGTSQWKFARLEKKRGDVIVQDLPGINTGEGLRTFSRVEGDVIILSRDEPTRNDLNPEETTGQSDSPIRTDLGAEEEVPYIPIRVVYCVVMEANPGIMSCRHDTYPSRHYAGCCLYLDGLEFYRIFLCNYITPFRTHRIYDVHV
jgi:hypothetical protein